MDTGQAIHLAAPTRPRSLTVALRRWPPALPTRRPHVRLQEIPWRPAIPLPRWLRHYLLVELPLPASVLPAVSSPFRDGLAAVPSCLAVQGVLAALHHADLAAEAWERAESGWPEFSYRKPGGTVITSVRSLWREETVDCSRGGAWATVRDLSDLDGDLLLIALAHALDHPGPDGTTWITADTILDERGIQPRVERAGSLRYRAGHRRDDRARVAAGMERLDRLWVELHDVTVIDPHGGRSRRTRLTHESKLLLVCDRLVQEGLPIAWRYRPGTWLEPFLARPNRQTALLARQVLRYDPYHARWEKRLGRYLTFHLRMNARRPAQLVRRVGTLLDDLRLPVDGRHPERTRSRLEKALDRLARDRVIGAWCYTPASHGTLAALPARGWVERWRALTIAVTPARPAGARYAAPAPAAGPTSPPRA